MIPLVVVTATIGIINASRSPDVYEAVASVLIEKQVPRVLNIEGVSRENVGWDPDYYATQVDIVRSRAVMELALEDPALSGMHVDQAAPKTKKSFLGELRQTVLALFGGVPAPQPEKWERIRSQVQIQHKPETHFVLIRSRGADPKRITRLVNAVGRSVEKYYFNEKAERFGDAFAFLDQEKQKQDELLTNAEKELQSFRENAMEVSQSVSEKNQPTLRRLSELSDRLTEVQMKRIELSSQIKVILDSIKDPGMSTEDKMERLFTVPGIRKDSTINVLQTKLNEARKQLNNLKDTYGPAHPLRRQAELEVQKLNQQFGEALKQAVLSLTNESKILRRQEEQLKEQRAEQKVKALDLAKEVFTFNRLQNEVKRHEKLYDMLVERLQEIDVGSGFIKTNAKLVEQASVPSSPVGPSRMRIVISTMLFGLVLGLGLAFVIENIDDTVKTPEDLKQRLGGPFLGFVPQIIDEEKKHKDDFLSRGLISFQKPFSSVAEAYRTIRTRLFVSISSDRSRIIGFTSCNPGEGKTTTASNLALVTAMAGKRTLLIDADVHRPMVHNMFGFKPQKGLTNVLTGEVGFEDVLRRFDFEYGIAEGLEILPAGEESPNPSELLGSVAMSELLDEVKKRYEWIFIDIPPILFVSDASMVGSLCAGLILVVRSGRNNRSILMRTREEIQHLNVPIIGSVLNDVVFSRIGRFYSDYRYYGYSDYSSEYKKSYYANEDLRNKAAGSGGNRVIRRIKKIMSRI